MLPAYVKALPLTLLSALFFSGCAREHKTTVVLDGWWSRDYAREGCETAREWWERNAASVNLLGCKAVTSCAEMMPRIQGCALDPVDEVRGFEAELASAFASDSSCKGLTLVRFNGPEEASAEISKLVSEPGWWLMLNFEIGEKEQDWDMHYASQGSNKKPVTHTSGKGSPHAIAHRVCENVKGAGGSVVD